MPETWETLEASETSDDDEATEVLDVFDLDYDREITYLLHEGKVERGWSRTETAKTDDEIREHLPRPKDDAPTAFRASPRPSATSCRVATWIPRS